MDIELFGKRLKELRGKASQADCAAHILEKTGISITAQTLGRYENGKRKPDIEIIEALAETFGVSADYLLCRTDVKTTDLTTKQICNYIGLSEKAINKLCVLRDNPPLKTLVERKYRINEAGRLIYILNKIIEHNTFNKLLDRINNHIDETIYFEEHSPIENKEVYSKIADLFENGWLVMGGLHAGHLRIEYINLLLSDIITEILKQEKALISTDKSEQE